MLETLEDELARDRPEVLTVVRELLEAQGMQMKALQAALQEALPNIIAIAWQPHAGTHHLRAVVADIVARMRYWEMQRKRTTSIRPGIEFLQAIIPSSSVEMVDRSMEAIMNVSTSATDSSAKSASAATIVRHASMSVIKRLDSGGAEGSSSKPSTPSTPSAVRETVARVPWWRKVVIRRR